MKRNGEEHYPSANTLCPLQLQEESQCLTTSENLRKSDDMNIKIIGMGCDDCDRLYENVVQAVKEKGIDAEIEKIGELIDIVKLGVMSAPSLMIDGKLVVAGRVVKKDEILRLMK